MVFLFLQGLYGYCFLYVKLEKSILIGFYIGKVLREKSRAWVDSAGVYFEGSFQFLISLSEEWFVRSKWRGVTDM